MDNTPVNNWSTYQQPPTHWNQPTAYWNQPTAVNQQGSYIYGSYQYPYDSHSSQYSEPNWTPTTHNNYPTYIPPSAPPTIHKSEPPDSSGCAVRIKDTKILNAIASAKPLDILHPPTLNCSTTMIRQFIEQTRKCGTFTAIQTANTLVAMNTATEDMQLYCTFCLGSLGIRLQNLCDMYMEYLLSHHNLDPLLLTQELLQYLTDIPVTTEHQFFAAIFPHISQAYQYFNSRIRIVRNFDLSDLEGLHISLTKMCKLAKLSEPNRKAAIMDLRKRSKGFKVVDTVCCDDEDEPIQQSIEPPPGTTQGQDIQMSEANLTHAHGVAGLLSHAKEHSDDDASEYESDGDEIRFGEDSDFKDEGDFDEDGEEVTFEEEDNAGHDSDYEDSTTEVEPSTITNCKSDDTPENREVMKEVRRYEKQLMDAHSEKFWALKNLPTGEPITEVTIPDSARGNLASENPTFQVHQVGKELVRGMVDPAVKKVAQFMEGQYTNFSPATEKVYGNDGKNRLFIDEYGKFIGGVIDGTTVPQDVRSRVDTELVPLLHQVMHDPQMQTTNTSKQSAGQVPMKLMALKYPGQVVQGRTLIRSNGTGIYTPSETTSEKNKKFGKNYKNLPIEQHRVGHHLIDKPGKKKEMKFSGTLFDLYPSSKDLFKWLGTLVWCAILAMGTVNENVASTITFMLMVAHRNKQHLLFDDLPWTGSNFSGNVFVANHTDKNNIPGTLSGGLYSTMPGIMNRHPDTYFSWVLYYVSILTMHCTVLVDKAYNNLHMASGTIWENAWRFLVNFYMHQFPEFTASMMDIGWEFYYHCGTIKEHIQAYKYCKLRKIACPPIQFVSRIEKVKIPPWEASHPANIVPAVTNQLQQCNDKSERFTYFFNALRKIDRFLAEVKAGCDNITASARSGIQNGNYLCTTCCEDPRSVFIMSRILQNDKPALRFRQSIGNWDNFFVILFQIVVFRICVNLPLFKQYFKSTGNSFPKNLAEFDFYYNWIKTNWKRGVRIQYQFTPLIETWPRIISRLIEERNALLHAAKQSIAAFLACLKRIAGIKNFHGSRIILDLVHYGFFGSVLYVHNTSVYLGPGAKTGYQLVFGHVWNEDYQSLRDLQKFIFEKFTVSYSLSDLEHGLCEFAKMAAANKSTISKQIADSLTKIKAKKKRSKKSVNKK